jgi:large subunit ribosomal protein L10
MNETILEQKKATVARLSKELSNAKCAVVVTYHNLDVADITALRINLKKNGGKMEVAKNTLVKRALDEENFKDLDKLLKGPNAILTGQDETKILSVILNFVATHREMEVKGAVIGGTYCELDKIKFLSMIPDKEAALASFCGTLQSPVVSFACALKAVADSMQK